MIRDKSVEDVYDFEKILGEYVEISLASDWDTDDSFEMDIVCQSHFHLSSF